MSASVFPAYVGMSLGGRLRIGLPQRVPRIRGDEPDKETGGAYNGTCSPHTWG